MPQKTNGKKIKNSNFQRYVQIDVPGSDIADRTFRAALSSETKAERWYGNEKLIHSDKAINMERANGGLPLLYNHDRDKLLGRVDNISLESDGILRGDLTFSESAIGDQALCKKRLSAWCKYRRNNKQL